jgi:hypothetical protein
MGHGGRDGGQYLLLLHLPQPPPHLLDLLHTPPYPILVSLGQAEPQELEPLKRSARGYAASSKTHKTRTNAHLVLGGEVESVAATRAAAVVSGGRVDLAVLDGRGAIVLPGGHLAAAASVGSLAALFRYSSCPGDD